MGSLIPHKEGKICWLRLIFSYLPVFVFKKMCHFLSKNIPFFNRNIRDQYDIIQRTLSFQEKQTKHNQTNSVSILYIFFSGLGNLSPIIFWKTLISKNRKALHKGPLYIFFALGYLQTNDYDRRAIYNCEMGARRKELSVKWEYGSELKADPKKSNKQYNA